MSPAVEKLLKDSRIYLTDAQLRVAASGFPDSALSYNWDGSSWELEAQTRINYTNFGKIANLIFYFDLGGNPVPVLRYEYTYDAAGRTTRIEVQQTIPGLPPAVMTRFTMNYDAQGNQTSMLVYEDDNGNLALSSGDSLQITYTAGVATAATRHYWDDNAVTPVWTPDMRFTNITFGTNGHPTALVISYWDNNTFTEEERITEISWKLGYPGFSITFGGLIDIGSFLFEELPSNLEIFGQPTDYIAEFFENNSWVLAERYVSTGTPGAISEILQQERAGNTWVDAYRNVLSYTGSRMTMWLSEMHNGTSWEPSTRESWTYDAQGNLTEEKYEFHTGTSWEVGFGNRNTFSYTADNKVYRWIGEQWDNASSAYVNALKRDYFFGAFPQSVVVNKLAALQVYPNPVQDALNIALESTVDSKLSAQIFNLQGQLVAAEVFALNAGKNQIQFDVANLANGIYQLRLQTANGAETVRFVK